MKPYIQFLAQRFGEKTCYYGRNCPVVPVETGRLARSTQYKGHQLTTAEIKEHIIIIIMTIILIMIIIIMMAMIVAIILIIIT